MCERLRNLFERVCGAKTGAVQNPHTKQVRMASLAHWGKMGAAWEAGDQD